MFQNKDLFSSNEVCLSSFKDVSSILCHRQSHGCHVIHALSDVHKLLGSAKAQLKSTSKGKEISNFAQFPFLFGMCYFKVTTVVNQIQRMIQFNVRN